MFRHLLDYVFFWLKSTNAHGIHSPFIFQLYNEVIGSEKEYYCFQEIENIRWQLLLDEKIITINDLGAGSKTSRTDTRKLNKIVNNSTTSPDKAQLLFKLVDFCQPATLLELGTSVGLTSLYLAEAMPTEATLYTFEGDQTLINIAKTNAEAYFKAKTTFPTSKNIEFVLGNIDETLSSKIKQLDKIDFAFFDANHREKPTLEYFELCLTKADENAVFVFDDIYWSAEMKNAWISIQKHPQVTISVDLFDFPKHCKITKQFSECFLNFPLKKIIKGLLTYLFKFLLCRSCIFLKDSTEIFLVERTNS